MGRCGRGVSGATVPMARTLILALAATGLLYGAGVAAPAPIAGDPTTTSLSCPTSLVFLGIEGDYKAVTADELHTWLTEEQKQVVFGKDLRALSDPTRRVWALETADAKKLHRSLKSKLQKKGFKATLLQATAVEPLEEDRRAVNSACREVEREDKVWTMWTSRRTPRIWVFHEPKLSGKKVEGLFRKTKSSVAYAHTEVSLTPTADVDLESRAKALGESLDALRVSTRDTQLVADLYLRDCDRLLVLHQDGTDKIVLCPPELLKAVPEDGDPAQWKVTLDNEGYPFLD